MYSMILFNKKKKISLFHLNSALTIHSLSLIGVAHGADLSRGLAWCASRWDSQWSHELLISLAISFAVVPGLRNKLREIVLDGRSRWSDLARSGQQLEVGFAVVALGSWSRWSDLVSFDFLVVLGLWFLWVYRGCGWGFWVTVVMARFVVGCG